MRVRKMTSSGDVLWGHGTNDFYVDQPEAVGQLAQTRLGMMLGEYFMNVLDGTPYMTEVLGSNTVLTRDLAIQDRILSTQGVTAITAYSPNFNPITRALAQAATIDTMYGSTTVGGAT